MSTPQIDWNARSCAKGSTSPSRQRPFDSHGQVAVATRGMASGQGGTAALSSPTCGLHLVQHLQSCVLGDVVLPRTYMHMQPS